MAFSKRLSQEQDRRPQTSQEELKEQDPAKMNWGWMEMNGRSQWIDAILFKTWQFWVLL